VQNGSVARHGKGWRGRWREDGRLHTTRTVRTKGEARDLLNRELRRIELGDRWRPPITLAELAERYQAQHDAAPRTITRVRLSLTRPLAAWGDAQASDLTTEAIQRLVAGMPVGDAFKRDVVRALRALYRFGIDARLVDDNPAARVRTRNPVRGERIIPFESWAEVERVAEEAGRWGPLIIFAVDSGARPGELVALEHRHVDGDRVYLPGEKTDGARRVVHLTPRGVAAYEEATRAISTPVVWHDCGRRLDWNAWRRNVWHTALELAELETRSPYCMRHTFSYFSLRAGVPVSDVAREMGHTDVSRTYRTYGMWIDELGRRAANLRAVWAENQTARDHPVTTETPIPVG
jgi:integrase